MHNPMLQMLALTKIHKRPRMKGKLVERGDGTVPPSPKYHLVCRLHRGKRQLGNYKVPECYQVQTVMKAEEKEAHICSV